MKPNLAKIFESYNGWLYFKSCVDFKGDEVDHLIDMIDEAVEVTYEELLGIVGEDVVRDVFPDYNWTNNPREGLTLKDDYHVRYARSRYREYPCYFVVHSAIEYIFLPDHAEF